MTFPFPSDSNSFDISFPVLKLSFVLSHVTFIKPIITFFLFSPKSLNFYLRGLSRDSPIYALKIERDLCTLIHPDYFIEDQAIREDRPLWQELNEPRARS